VHEDDGAIIDREVSNRRAQRGAKFCLHDWVVNAFGQIFDRVRVLSVLVGQQEDRVEGDLVTSVPAATELLVGGVHRDTIDSGSEGGIAPERVDLPKDGPENILEDFLGIRSVVRDPDRQSGYTVAVRGDELLGGSRRAQTQCFDKLRVMAGSEWSVD
jgi:hypothetical protein